MIVNLSAEETVRLLRILTEASYTPDHADCQLLKKLCKGIDRLPNSRKYGVVIDGKYSQEYSVSMAPFKAEGGSR